MKLYKDSFLFGGLVGAGIALGIVLLNSSGWLDAVERSNIRYAKQVSEIACYPGEIGVIQGGGHNSNPGEVEAHSGFLQVSCEVDHSTVK